MELRLAIALLAACGGGKKLEDAAPKPIVAADAGSGSAVVAPGKTGDVQVRVEWHDVPVAMRASPGRTACKTPRAPYVAPTTTWGVPDAIVWAGAGTAAAGPVRIAWRDCVMVPRVAVAKPGATLAIVSGSEGPVTVALTHHGDPKDDKALNGIIETPGSLPAGVLDRISLPVVGHEVDVTLARPAVDAVGETDPAWVLTAPGAAGVTDAAGQVVLKDLPTGSHALTAWIPPRADQPARIVRGKVEIVAGAQAEVTLTIEK